MNEQNIYDIIIRFCSSKYLTDANFEFNRTIHIENHGSFVEASKQLVFAATEVWLKKKKRFSMFIEFL